MELEARLFWIGGLASLIVSIFTTWLAIGLSHRLGALDRPNERSSHIEPTPRLGGLGILSAAGLTYAAFIVLGSFRVVPYPVISPEKIAMLSAGLAMAALGLYDDFHHLTPGRKLMAQLLLATVIVTLGYRIEWVGVAGWGPLALGWWSFPLTILWFVGFSNSFNFMDGINGMSAGSAALHFLFFAAFAWEFGMPALVVLAVILAGACLGFLPHNFPRARTFMGDCGSLPLGFTLAFFVVHMAQWAAGEEALPALVMVCAVSLWDTGFTFLRRLKRGEAILRSHRQHLYQRLVQLGHSHAKITGLYFTLHALMGILALLYLGSSPAWRGGLLLLVVAILTGFTCVVYWLERRAAPAGLSDEKR
jgi:UDP-N-acetylmuramyl pentapeptide phosphotransferase/UDP-N-acetylglucosamine-1-phosphate transferase